ncbi:MAG TPA: VOC family protein [Candidatus Eisenbacteria bacterium]
MAHDPIDPATRVGAVHLTVADLPRAVAFYRDRLGMALLSQEGPVARLGAAAGPGAAVGPELLVLTESPGARHLAGRTGLYHFALLTPSRADLARSVHLLAAAGQRFQGFSDHLVSESAYLADPEGNGIEIYRDRPREEWPRENGGYVLGLEPLDLEGLLEEADRPASVAEGAPLAAGTVMGHVHLRVADLSSAEAFYVEALGLDVTARYDRSALFVSAGGYHHHVGLNIWGGAGAPPPPSDGAGLRHFELVLPHARARDRVLERLTRAAVALEETDSGVLARDPSRNGVMLTVGTNSPAR